jgi:lipopolysaccharide export system protein LptA
MISKEKLSFDPTDAESLAASDIVGARLLAGTDGDELDSTSGALHVSDGGGSITVDATDLDIRDLAFATDSVDVSGSSVSISGDVNVTQGTSPWVVSATDLDIRDLAFATDKVDISGSSNVAVVDGGGSLTVDASDLDIRDLAFATDKVDVSGSSVSISGDVNVTQGTSPWVVSATDLDIRDLDAAQDSIESWTHDGSGNAITSTTGWLDVNIAGSDIEINVEDDKANTALLSTANSIGTTAEALLASQLAARRFLWVQNLGPNAMYVGDSSVTVANGIRFSNGAIGEFRFGPAISLFAVTNAGAADARMLEAS